LVVDDDPFTLDALSEVVGLDGLRTIGARNGEEALARTQKRRPWLVVTDYRMAAMSGADLVRALRERHPGLPAVVMTEHTAARGEIEALPAHYVAKPISLAALVRAIAAATDGRP
jgi:two-component system nitrogen regulation response regulator GlnG